ncbi:response regulator [Yoonia sp. BS5-3]|uniref:Response regulator n=1 Tax=Yoonia phaeophyticola TaxID=3137369 RepID=A0ABZ2V8M0_9RHOB
MSQISQPEPLSNQLSSFVPALRRHARALTGDQDNGDQFALATLESILQKPDLVQDAASLKVGLFGVFFQAWDAQTHPITASDDPTVSDAQQHLRLLTPDSRHALLLHSIEQFSIPEIAQIMARPDSEVQRLISDAHAEIAKSIAGRILVIEDEAMIAMDLQDIVEEMGHSVTGMAATHSQAITLAQSTKPDLILSDIQLGDGSSGIDAVAEILTGFGDIPVIFITAFPEYLLTGERPEPAFVMTKPYSAEQVKSALSQAMFFRSSCEIEL